MEIPVVRGVIERRLLINYRVDPAVLETLLPFRPKLVGGVGLVGICLIRLRGLRPAFLPRWFGASSENAAHRAAVEWDDNGTVREGVYVRRRDTNSRFNSLAGGRLFPGFHRLAQFAVDESDARFNIAVQSDDGRTRISLAGRRATQWPAGSVFDSLDEASAFFEGGSLGYSATPNPSRFHGLELRCSEWRVEPVEVQRVCSSYFDDASLFPRGSIEFDCALLMREIEHEWHSLPDLDPSAEARPRAVRPQIELAARSAR
jgi:hypothetical protein